MDRRLSPLAATPEPIVADHEPGGLAPVLPLSALAGWVDALGFVQWHGMFVSFTSGDSTALGASPALGDWQGTIEAVLLWLALACVMLLLTHARSKKVSPFTGSSGGHPWRGRGRDGVDHRIGHGPADGGRPQGRRRQRRPKSCHRHTGQPRPQHRGGAASRRRAAAWRPVPPLLGCWLALVATRDALGVVAALASAVALLPAAGVVRRRRAA